MKIAKDLVKNLIRIHIISYKVLHIIPICITIGLWILTNIYPIRESIDYIGILNTIGILTVIYLFGMEKIDLEDMMKRFTKDSKRMPLSGKVYKQGIRIVYTYYSLLLIEVFLIGIQYVLYLFQFGCSVLLLLSICYILTAITFTILCWHGYLFMIKYQR